jgi:hypothetical protein
MDDNPVYRPQTPVPLSPSLGAARIRQPKERPAVCHRNPHLVTARIAEFIGLNLGEVPHLTAKKDLRLKF